MSLVNDSISFSSLEFSSKAGRVKCLSCNCCSFFTRKSKSSICSFFYSFVKFTSTSSLIELQLNSTLRINPKQKQKQSIEEEEKNNTKLETLDFRIEQLPHLHFESMLFDHRHSKSKFRANVLLFFRLTSSSARKFRSRTARFRNSLKLDVKSRLVIQLFIYKKKQQH